MAYGDRIKVTTSTTGTGSLTLSSTGVRDSTNGDCLAPAEVSALFSQSVPYFITSGANWASGIGTLSSNGLSLTRDASEKSWNGTTYATSTLSLTGTSTVFISPRAADMAGFVTAAAGSNGQLQFNSSNAFAGDTGLTYDSTNKALSVGGATVTTSNPVLNLSQTWNAGAVTFTGIKFNVTNTASASASLLADLQVGGTSKFSVDVFGNVTTSGAIASGTAASISSNGLRLGNSVPIAIGSGSIGGTLDVTLYRDAADIFAQRRSTNAQALRVYNTYTDASNGEWFSVDWKTTANTAILGTQKNGTGSTRAISIVTGGTEAINIGTAQNVTVSGKLNLTPTSGSAAAWTTSGIALTQASATWTDSSTATSGTVTTAYMNVFNAQTYAASNTGVTVTNVYGNYFVAPVAGTNVTITNKYALGADSMFCTGNMLISGTSTLSGNLSHWGSATGTHSFGINQTTATISIGGTSGTGSITLGQSTLSQTVGVANGATTTGNTKTVNIGTSGASGSTTTITVGGTAGTSTTTLNGSTICAGTIQMQSYTVSTLPAAGTAGRRAYVTDATAPTFLGALTGGGSVKCPVFDNGTSWVAG